MARVTITPEHVEAALEAAEYATVDENIQAVLKEIKARPALLTAYLSAVINATDLPDHRRMDSLF